MGTREDADLRGERTDLVHRAAVNTFAGEQELTDDELLEHIDAVADEGIGIGVLVGEVGFAVGGQFGDTGIADGLVVGIDGAHGIEGVVVDFRSEDVSWGAAAQ